MAARIISGEVVAKQIRTELSEKVEQLKMRGVTPSLVVVLVGDEPASVSYVTGKAKACEELGIEEKTIRLPEDTPEADLIKLIDKLNNNSEIHGILVQLPLPRHIDEKRIINAILPAKDVDGLHPANVGKLLCGEPGFIPCTPYGVQQLLIRSGNSPEGKHVVICGRSNLVGKPLSAILIQKGKGANATVTIVHTGTKDMATLTRQADILVAAMGQPNTIVADMVKEGAVVIDVGVNRVNDSTRKNGFRLVGDVDFEMVQKKASFITPVPGGVGPMTITMLMANTVTAAERDADARMAKK